MIVRGAYHVAGTPETIYHLLQDGAILSAAIPGCRELLPLGPGKFSIKMNVAIAAMNGDFQGIVEATDHEPPHRFRMTVEATGRLGSLKGDGLLTFQPGPQGSAVVSYDGSAAIGGPIASVGHRLLDATARMMIRRFFEQLEGAIASAGSNDRTLT
jgi:uncharacterized protein